MKTELKPRVNSGFFLNAIELTRIKDSQNEQIKKISGQDAVFSYELKYRNGTIYKPSSVDEITSEENDGSRRILRLIISAKSAKEDLSAVSLTFSDTSYKDNSDLSPISYSVSSDDKDWTFVTASTIEERISKTKVKGILNYINSDNVFPLALALITPLFLVSLYFFFLTQTSQK